jgi:hypothetical protein
LKNDNGWIQQDRLKKQAYIFNHQMPKKPLKIGRLNFRSWLKSDPYVGRFLVGVI